MALLVVFMAACGGGSPVDEARVEQGRAIYAQDCVACHGDPVTGAGGIQAAPPHGPDGHTWHHADELLADIILGRLDYPGRTMPSFEGRLSEEEVASVLALFKAGWGQEQREFQEEASRNFEAQN